MTNLALKIEVSADASQARAGLRAIGGDIEGVKASASDASAATRSAAQGMVSAGDAARAAAGDMRGMAGAADATATALTAQAAAARAGAQAVAEATRSEIADLQRLVAAIDPVAAAFQRTSEAQTQLDRALKAGHLTAERHAQLSGMLAGELDRAGKQAAKTAGANDNLARTSGLAAYQQRQLAMQASDAAQSLMLGMPPLQVLLQQGPQAADAVGGISKAFSLVGSALRAIPLSAAVAGTGIGAVLVVAGFAISRISDMAAETRAFSTVLKGMGQDAFVSTQQLHQMVETMRDAGVSKEEARGTVANLQRNQLLSQSDRGRIAGLSADVGAGLGNSAADAAKKLSDALSGGYSALKQFDNAVNFLTASERSQIRTMLEHGERASALEIAYAALDRRFTGLQAGSMSQAERAWLNLGRAWSRFVDAIATSRPVIATIELLSSAVGKIADFLDRGGAKGGAAAEVTDLEGQIAQRRARLERLRQPGPDDASNAIDPQRRAQYAAVEEAALMSLEAQLRKVEAARASAKDAEAANENERQKKEVDDVAASVAKLASVYGTEKNARDAARAAAEAKAEADEKGITGAERERLIRLRVAEATAADAAAIRDRNQASFVQVTATDAVIASYQKSLREGLKADAARQASLEQLDNKQVDVAARARQLLDEGAKAAGEAAAKSIGANEAELYRLGLVAEAAKGTSAAYADTKIQVDALARSYADVEAARATGDEAALQAAQARRDTLTGQLRDEERLNETIRARREIVDAEADLAIQRRELELAQALPDVRERELALMREKLRIQQQFPGLGEEERQKLLQIADARASIKVATEQQQRAAEETGRIWTRAAEGIQDALSSAFEAAFDKSKRAGFSFGQVLKSFLLSTASQIATAFVFKPVIGNVLSAVGAPQSWLVSLGYAGANSASSSVASPDRGGGFSLGSIDRLFSANGSSLSPAIDAWAMRNIGWGVPNAVSGATSATAAEMIQATAAAPGLLNGGSAMAGFSSFSNILGIAGSVLPGLLSGNYGQAIGGGLGAAVGTMILPGIGTMVGGMLGNLVGGMFGGDKQSPRGYAGGQIGTDGRFSASDVHQAGLDGYSNAADRQEMAKFATWMNAAMDRYDLSFAVNKDTINANGAYNGLLTIGTMYGGAANAEDLAKRWFTTDRSKSGGANASDAGMSEFAYQRAQGITTWFDRDNGMSYYDRDGRAIDRETYNKNYGDWRTAQSSAASPTDSGSLFKSDNAGLQKALDRLASGALKADSTEQLTKYLDFAQGFDRSKALAAAGVGTRDAQALSLKYAAQDAAKAQAKGIKEYIGNAEAIYGADSQEAKDAKTAARQQALASLETVTDDAKKPLTGFAADVAAIKAQFAELGPVLEAAGVSASEAAATISTKLTARLQQMQKDWSQNLQDQRAAVEDPRGLARRQMKAQDDQLRAEAGQLGTDSAKQEAESFIAWRSKRQEDAWAEQDKRFGAALDQRAMNAAVVIDPRRTREAEDKARAEAQRQELVDAQNSGATASQLDQIRKTQTKEEEAVAAARKKADKRSAEDQALTRDGYAVQTGDLSQRELEDRQRAARQRRAVEDATTEAEARDIEKTNAAENAAVAKTRAKADRRMGQDQALSRQDMYAEMGLISRQQAEDDQRRIRQARALEDATTEAERAEIQRTAAVEDAVVAYRRAMDVYNQQIALEQRRGQAAASILRTVGGAQNVAAADAIDRRLLEIQQQQELATVTDATVRARMIETQAMETQALAIQQAAAASADARENFKKFAEDVKKFRDDLRTSQLSPLEGMAKLADAKSQFEAVSAKAATGDKTAIAEVTGKAQTYLELAQAAYGGNQEYAAIFAQVDAGLAALQLGAEGQVSTAQRQLDTLAAQAVVLGGMASSLGNIERPIATVASTAEPALTAAKTTASETEKIAKYASDQLDKQKAMAVDLAGSKLANDNTARDTAAVLLKSSAIAADQGRTAKATEASVTAIGDLAAAMRTMPAPIVSVTVMAPPTPAFASGGDHAGGWALVGERGPEYAYFGGPARIYNAEQTRGMRQAGGDGRLAVLLAEQLRQTGQSNELLQALLGLIGDVASVQHDSDTTLIRTLSTLVRSAEWTGYMTVAA
ncbi:MAG: phage tail length tape measure family protein [Alphaproteobacteria bacterium]|nr:phage tail length tape measure family protein [Alphaproteobacteria bacterium]